MRARVDLPRISQGDGSKCLAKCSACPATTRSSRSLPRRTSCIAERAWPTGLSVTSPQGHAAVEECP
jgi:hypothetical protein